LGVPPLCRKIADAIDLVNPCGVPLGSLGDQVARAGRVSTRRGQGRRGSRVVSAYIVGSSGVLIRVEEPAAVRASSRTFSPFGAL